MRPSGCCGGAWRSWRGSASCSGRLRRWSGSCCPTCRDPCAAPAAHGRSFQETLMITTIALLIAGLALPPPTRPDTLAASCPHVSGPSDSVLACLVQPSDTGKRRPRAIEYSDWYARRLEIHRIGSYTMLPLFAAEYTLGNQLLHGADPHSATGHAHALVAGGIGVLFVVNTGTGLWNLWDSRQDPAGRTRRLLHSSLMLA